MLYRLVNGRDQACIEAVKRLAADAIPNSTNSSLINDNITPVSDSLHIMNAFSYNANDAASTHDGNILHRLFVSSTNAENSSANTTTTTSDTALRAAVSKRLIDDVAFVKRIGRVPESQNLDIKALFKSGITPLLPIFITCYAYII